MRAVIQRMGNSAGVILPKPILAEFGLKTGDDLTLTMEKGRVTLASAHPRAGWADAAKEIAAAGDDRLLWTEFGNVGDCDLKW